LSILTAIKEAHYDEKGESNIDDTRRDEIKISPFFEIFNFFHFRPWHTIEAKFEFEQF
jgi:hypothetical protein